MEKNYKKTMRRLSHSLFGGLLCALLCVSLVRAESVQKGPLVAERLDNYLKKIELAYQVSFVYDASQINKSMSIDVPSKLTSINSDLEPLKANGINYNIVGKQVILKKIIIPVTVRELIVKGHVTSTKDKESLPGVSVKEKGVANGVSTNGDGFYQIKVREGATLVFSAIGYKTREVAVSGRTSIDVSLDDDVSQLKEVMISTGYQNISKKLFTGSAVTLSGADAKRDGIADVSRMLEGRVAGVSVQNVSGTFGAAPKIRVRGATSITGDNKPLWVVDGVVLEDVVNVSNEQLSTGDPSTLLGSAVAGLNSDDIESFQILKDASATSLYGARAMNGVILITTKKGKVGDGSPAISYTANLSSYLKPTYRTFDIMNSYDQMSVYSEMYRKGLLNYSTTVNEANGGVYKKLFQSLDFAPGSTVPTVINTLDGRSSFLTRYANANTDWFDVLFKNSFMQEHSLSVSTGTEKSQMYYSTSYLKDNGWTIGDKVQRFTGNVRGNWKINDKISFGLITTGSVRDQKAPGTLGRTTNPVTGEYSRDFDLNPFSYALNTSRTLTPYDENGNLEYFTRNYAPFNIIDELRKNTLDLTQIDFKVQGEGQYKILKNLTYNFLGSYRYTKSGQEHKVFDDSNTANAYRAGVYPENSFIRDNNRFLYKNPTDPDAYAVSVLPNGGIYYTNDDFMKSFFVRNSLDWNQTFNEKHIVRVFASQELRYADRQNTQFTGYGYQYDKGGTPFIDPNAIKQAVEGNFNYYSMVRNFDRYVAFAGTASYSYNNKYQLNGTIRYDGSNQVGESAQARWLPTWNVSGSWNADEEEFMKRQETISKLTLRATYGLTASLGNATNSSLIVRSSSTLRPRLSEIENRLTIASLANSELTWEKQYEANVGLDVGLFKNRMNVTVDAYRRSGFDLIGQIRNSGIGGEVLKYANYADMISKGIEGSVGGDIVREKNWGWKSQITFGYNKGRITNLKGEPTIFDQVGPDGGPQIGHPYRGLYSIDFQKLSADNGVPFFINEAGELSNEVYLQSTITDYLKYEGPIDPLFNGGFYNSFNYKNFTASVLLTFSAGNKVRLNPAYKNVYSDLDATPNDFLNRFLFYGDSGTPSILDPRNRTALNGAYPYNAYNYSTERVADGGFVRLKSISFGYTLPKQTINRIGFKTASLNVVGNNLFLIYSDKKLNGQDPEFFSSGGVALPIPQQFTLSLKVGL
ncbi:SusC/RagA family TonB-linked outer membrane protein [Pedobacter sp. MC2016-24]|uniref:SusC/RagA family TonB-linked outer membrane protein n=1 Tax=Pedobacter sp. MC2016-24 TaxID=2780090 RepID=UPI0018801289|nr:SusC/RagA family TonB-linked outer membrane protein [Pedobacter sp. MC2016-24]MBE9598960.1 SusC/RagA family TonB-linked outer membrane protein [Pedobacter sp. MC2016-24]